MWVIPNGKGLKELWGILDMSGIDDNTSYEVAVVDAVGVQGGIP